MVYCELDRIPLIFMRKVRIVKYCNTLTTLFWKPLGTFYLTNFVKTPKKQKWGAGVNNMLAEIGLGDFFFYNYGTLECKHVLGLVNAGHLW